MKVLLAISILFFLVGCGSGRKEGEGYVCRTTNVILDAQAAERAQVLCTQPNGLKTFKAQCDFTVDPVEFGRSFIAPKTMEWAYRDEMSGINFTYDNGQGFLSCSKLN